MFPDLSQDIVLYQDKGKRRAGGRVSFKVLHSKGKRFTLGRANVDLLLSNWLAISSQQSARP